MSLRVLMVDSDPEETLFLQDVLAEIQEGGYWAGWVGMECLHAPTWSDAESILLSESVDVLLLSLELEDAHGSDSFRRAQSLVPRVPIILLVSETDTELAIRLVREGAQDYTVPSRIECAILAHAMRNAIERQRLLTSLRSASLTDALTGLLNATGFAISAERERKLAERLRSRLMLVLAEPRNIAEISATHGEHKKDLIMIEAADHMRGLTGPSDLLGRASDTRLGLVVFDMPVESVEAAWSRIRSAGADHRIDIGAAIFDADHPAGLDSLFDQAIRDLIPGSALSEDPAPSLNHKTAGMRT
jgi:PleD family two-component response regulator